MTEYPKDPAMLMSWVNMKLRDFYGSLDELCEELEIDRKELEKRLKEAGFEYNQELNKFW
jgi:DNA-binding NtrC family response regulator